MNPAFVNPLLNVGDIEQKILRVKNCTPDLNCSESIVK